MDNQVRVGLFKGAYCLLFVALDAPSIIMMIIMLLLLVIMIIEMMNMTQYG